MNPRSSLTVEGKRWRVLYLALLPCALVSVAFVQPERLASRLPFPTSCGAITGLPCIFCGMTRAVHYLLRADWEHALYYNWIAFPLLVWALGFAFVAVFELVLDYNLLLRLPRWRVTRLRLGLLGIGLALLWCLQVYLAVSQHKTELLNPRGPLYSLVAGLVR